MINLLIFLYIVGMLGAGIYKADTMEMNAEYDDWAHWQKLLVCVVEGAAWPGVLFIQGKVRIATIFLGLAAFSQQASEWFRNISKAI